MAPGPSSTELRGRGDHTLLRTSFRRHRSPHRRHLQQSTTALLPVRSPVRGHAPCLGLEDLSSLSIGSCVSVCRRWLWPVAAPQSTGQSLGGRRRPLLGLKAQLLPFEPTGPRGRGRYGPGGRCLRGPRGCPPASKSLAQRRPGCGFSQDLPKGEGTETRKPRPCWARSFPCAPGPTPPWSLTPTRPVRVRPLPC